MFCAKNPSIYELNQFLLKPAVYLMSIAVEQIYRICHELTVEIKLY